MSLPPRNILPITLLYKRELLRRLLYLRFLYFRFEMPLFSNRFAPRTIPVRRQDTSVIKTEFGSDYAAKELSLDMGPIKMKLGDFEMTYEEGQWIPASGKAGAAHKENIRLKKELEQLEEENNMLRVKFEILLDMMTETTVEGGARGEGHSASLGALNRRRKRW